MVETDDSLPRLLGGRYRLEAKLGHGGMGVVYRAVDLMMHRPVAVKLIRSGDGVEIDEEVAGRFLREAKNTARVQHEHIIEIFDLGRSPDGLFFVMELLEGESLSARIRRLGHLTAPNTVHIATQICAALHVAHAAGVIHRDLKPANVMIVRRAGDDDFVKVLDFGVAKSYSADQTQLTHTGMLVGTVEYMAPEQIMGRKVDPRTDIYALGVVLYRMLAGRPPFRDGGVPAMINAHLNRAPKPLVEVDPEIPATLDRVILRCLAKAPEERYESMVDLSRALQAALATETLGLPDLEYDPSASSSGSWSGETRVDDIYANVAPTEVVKKALPKPSLPHRQHDPDEPTVKLERAPLHLPRSSRPPPPVQDQTAAMVDEYPVKRLAPLPPLDEGGRTEPKVCAMCQTVNPPHARACGACGVSLAAGDQEAVRSRVTAKDSRHLVPPPDPPQGQHPSHPAQRPSMPPLSEDPRARPFSSPPSYPPSSAPPPFAQQMGGWGPLVPVQPPSLWARFLVWLGLR